MTGGTLGKCYYVQHPYDQEGAYHRGKVIRVGGVDVCEERDAGSTKLGTLGEGATFEIKETGIEFRSPEIFFVLNFKNDNNENTSHFVPFCALAYQVHVWPTPPVREDGRFRAAGRVDFLLRGRSQSRGAHGWHRVVLC